jgi:hypothetical protein
MVVFSNHRLGPSIELLVSDEVARALLRATAAAATPFARARWEIELVQWLDGRADRPGSVLDVEDIAWTPEHFENQRRFLLDAIDHAASAEHALAFARWRKMVEAHPAESVQVGRRWRWPAGARSAAPHASAEVAPGHWHGENNPTHDAREDSPMRDTARDAADGGECGPTLGYVGAADLSLGR